MLPFQVTSKDTSISYQTCEVAPSYMCTWTAHLRAILGQCLMKQKGICIRQPKVTFLQSSLPCFLFLSSLPSSFSLLHPLTPLSTLYCYVSLQTSLHFCYRITFALPFLHAARTSFVTLLSSVSVYQYVTGTELPSQWCQTGKQTNK